MIEWWFYSEEKIQKMPPSDRFRGYTTDAEILAAVEWDFRKPQLLKIDDRVYVRHTRSIEWKRYPDFDTAVVAIRLRG